MNVLKSVSTVLLISCGAAACTSTPAPAADPVKVTTTLADVEGCSPVGKVIVSDTDPDAARAARNQTAGLGGNVLLRQNELVWNGSAYHCPPAAAH
jgi:hypothetical protein